MTASGDTSPDGDISSLFSVRGKVAVVTGGSRGIGAMIASGLVRAGCRVYITARKAAECDAKAAELSAFGECVSVPANLGVPGGVDQLMQVVEAREDRLHILVNNAGAAWGADFDEFPESGWDKVLDLNLKSPFFLTQALHARLAAAGSAEQPAKVIMIASIDGMKLNPQETYSYHASKSGLIYLTRRLAARLIRDWIVVSCIAPGPFASQMNRDARDHGDEVAKRVPMRRIGRDEDMAGAAIYLASRAGDYVVGETIAVDGGIALAT
jgi:2-deoxy-D-gluconate 3-dehydrogenase